MKFTLMPYLLLLCSLVAAAPVQANPPTGSDDEPVNDAAASEPSESRGRPRRGRRRVPNFTYTREGTTIWQVYGTKPQEFEDLVQEAKRQHLAANGENPSDVEVIEDIWTLLKEPDFEEYYQAFITTLGYQNLRPGDGALHSRLFIAFHSYFLQTHNAMGGTVADRLNELANYLRENESPEEFRLRYTDEDIRRLKAESKRRTSGVIGELRAAATRARTYVYIGCAVILYLAGRAHQAAVDAPHMSPESQITREVDPLPPATDVRQYSRRERAQREADEAAQREGDEARELFAPKK